MYDDVMYSKIFSSIENYRDLSFEDEKYSYLIVKPNGEKHFNTYVEELKKQKFKIIDFFAIFDYETLNIALHPTEPEQRHIVPINNMFKDFYSNYAILILISKSNITYKDFVRQVHLFKNSIRKRFEVDYVSYAFDIAELLNDNQHQRLKILDSEGKEVNKLEMNHEGTFLVFNINSLHSPDPDVNVTISELELLKRNHILIPDNVIPKVLVTAIQKYETFSFLKDL